MFIVQSRWSIQPLTYDEALLIVWSNLLLRKHYRAQVFFVTDPEGYDTLRELVPSNSNLDMTGHPPRVWALGKLAALLWAYESQRFAIHVDSDVFLGRRLPKELEYAPVVAQSPDAPQNYHSEDMRVAMASMGYNPRPGMRAYNAGIIGGERSRMKAWCERGLDLVRRIPSGVNGTAASMAVEQFRLGCDFHQGVHTLFETERPNPTLVRFYGYSHWVGAEKWKPARIEEIERKLALNYPRELDKVKAKGLPRHAQSP